MKRTYQNELVDCSSTKRAFAASSQSQGKRYIITSAAVRNCLYERKQLVFIDANKLLRLNFEGFNKQLLCLLCKKAYSEPCPLHGLGHAIVDNKRLQGSRAMKSLPPEVSLCRSSIPGTGLGVCTRKHIPAGTCIGPFEGRRIRPEEVKPGMDTSYMWEIFDGSKLTCFIDGSDEETSGWMRFIQCARSKVEQNLYAFQYKGEVYYRAFKDVAVGKELLVWYDERYVQHFGIPFGYQSMSLVKDFEDARPMVKEQTGDNKSAQQKPVCAPASLLPRQLSSDSDVDGQRSSSNSDVESDPGNTLVPFPKKSPEREFTSWRCQQCRKTFTQRVALQLHVCPCQPSKPYQCGQCSLAFCNSSQLRAHVTSHSSEKPFKCGFCSRAFVGATTLNNHIKSHFGQKPFGCDKCGKTFSQPGLLSRHQRNPRECKSDVSPPTVNS